METVYVPLCVQLSVLEPSLASRRVKSQMSPSQCFHHPYSEQA